MKIPAPILAVMAAIFLMAPARPQDKPKPSPNEQIEESSKKVKELQKERIATLTKIVDQLTTLVKNAQGSYSYDDVFEAQILLFKAELDAAEKESDRIALYKQTVDVLKKLEKLAQTRVDAGRGLVASVLKVKARRLEVEIQLEQAKVREAKASK